MKFKTLVLSSESRLAEVCTTRCRELLAEVCEPVWNTTGREYTQEEVADLIADTDILLTSWGSPNLNDQILSRATQLKAVAHAAGSVKRLVPRTIFERDIAVFSAAPRIAWSVGEYCLTALLTLMNRLHQFDATIRAGGWKTPGLSRHELFGRTVGIVSASSTARAFIKLLTPFNCKIHVYDPYLSDEAAEQLGVTKAGLQEIMQCEIISIHAPSIPATENLITDDLLRLIPAGAIFINSSRAAVLNEESLIAELQTGRFVAALDVFIKEPLLPDHPFRTMDNVLLSPHMAGNTIEMRQSLMEEALRDALRYLNGEQPKYLVNQKMWDILA
ncbi:MAG: hypothetical protein JWN30_1145 [Bacilli bacterium]|nr:hypothetical protein [Bacilli bacterium]